MSTHINSIATSSIPKLSAEEFTAKAETGMLLFASHVTAGHPVSALIQDVTKSPFSHVGMVYQEPITGKHLILESVWPGGARMGSFDYYVEDAKGGGYDGDLVLCDIPHVALEVVLALKIMLTQLDQRYDVEVEIQMLAKKLIHAIKPESGLADHTCECAEYVANGLIAAGYKVDQPSTPELLWLLDFVNPLWALVKA